MPAPPFFLGSDDLLRVEQALPSENGPGAIENEVFSWDLGKLRSFAVGFTFIYRCRTVGFTGYLTLS